MAEVYGASWKKQELLRRIGHVEQIAQVKACQIMGGKASGVKTYEVSNGCLDFTVLESRGMDISSMKYRGVNLSFLAKSGLVAQNLYSSLGEEAFKSLSGGMLYTCGLLNTGAVNDYHGKYQFFHGSARNIPAENVGVKCEWVDDQYLMKIHGDVRESRIFGSNIVMRRLIKTALGSKKIWVSNEIENEAYYEEPFMILLHINPGFPILDKGSELIAPVLSVEGRTDNAKKELMIEGKYAVITEPEDHYQESVFRMELAADSDNNTMAAFVNHKMDLGVYVKYNKSNLPYFTFWKSMASGDYAVGLHPCNSYNAGRNYEEENGNLVILQPGERIQIDFELGVLDGKEEIERFREKVAKLKRDVI